MKNLSIHVSAAKILLVGLFAFSAVCHLFAQTTVTINYNQTNYFVNGPWDIYDGDYTATGDIYKYSEINTSGTITKLAWDIFSASNVNIPVKVYLKLVPTTTTTWTSGTSYSTALSGATLVYSGIVNTNGNGWYDPITLQTPFSYSTANNLEVITEADKGSTDVSSAGFYANTTAASADCYWTASVEANLPAATLTSGDIDEYRPAIEITITPCSTAPTISSFTPDSACAGSGVTITVNGDHFVSGNTSATINGTTATVTFIDTTQIQLTLPAGASGTGNIVVTTCTSVTSGSAFTVNALPAFITNPSSATQNICINGTAAALTVSASGGGTLTYQWYENTSNSNSGGTAIGGNTTSYTPVTTVAGTLYYYCVVSGLCSPPATSSVSGAINVENSIIASIGTISGPDSVCSGVANTFSVAAVPNAAFYTWSLSGGWTGTSTTDNITVTASSSAGAVSVTAGNACGSTTAATLAVSVVTATGTPGAISGPTSVCASDVYTYSIAPVSGATSYTWTLPAGWTGSSSSDSIQATAGSSGGNITVKANGYCGSSSTRTLAVSMGGGPPEPGPISGPTTVCTASTDTYWVAPVAGATSYTWTMPNGWSGSSTTDTIISIEGTGGGTIHVTANSGCGASTAQTLAVTIGQVPSAPGAISGPDSVCSGSTNTFSIASVSGATFYTWSLPVGWTGSSTTNSISATAGTGGGEIKVTAGNSCGSSSFSPLIVTISSSSLAMPAAIIGPDSTCASITNTYSVAPVSGATSYTWTLPNSWTGTSTSDSIQATSGASGGNISVSANGACGNGPAQTLAVTINQAPATPGAISGPGSVCSVGNDTFSVAPVSGATTYTWTLPGGWTGSSASDSIIATTTTSGGVVSVSASNACGSSAAQTLTISTSGGPAMPGTITATGTACPGNADTFSIAPVSGATSYTWTLPNGWSGSSNTVGIDAIAGSGGGLVSVTANNGCGSSSAQILSVSSGSAPVTPGAITATGGTCSGSTDTFSIAPVSGASSYTWTLPNGWSGSSDSVKLYATPGSSGGTVSVTANNGCGSSPAQTLNVTVNAAPATPGAISGPGSVCSAGNDTFSIAPVAGATSYTWTLPGGWTGTSTNDSIIASTNTSGGVVSVSANNACGSSAAQTLTVNTAGGPAMPGTISVAGNMCGSSADTFSIAPVNGATNYTWTLPNGWTGSSTSTTLIALTGSTGGTVSVTANNACGSSAAQTLNVTLNTAPATPDTISGPDIVCSGASNTYSVATVSGASSYTWNLPGGWSGTSTTENINTTAGSAGSISVTANNACGSSTAQTLAITIGSLPATPGAISGPDSICNGTTADFSVAPVTGATAYIWTLPSGWTGSSGTNSISATGATASGTIYVADSNGCGQSTAQSKSVTLNPVPAVSLTSVGKPVCNNVNPTITLTGGSPSGGTYFGQGVTGDTFDASGLAAGDYVITYFYTSALGCRGSDTSSIIVTVCSGIDNTEEVLMSVYPNPFSDELMIRLSNNSGDGFASLMDASGRELMRTRFAAGTTDIRLNTNGLASGAYLLSLSYNGEAPVVKKVFRVE